MFKTLSVAVVLTAAASLASAANAQERLRYGDLDLNTERGVRALHNRIANLAQRNCAGEMTTGSRTTGRQRDCERSFRSAAMNALPFAQRDQVRATEQSTALVRAR